MCLDCLKGAGCIAGCRENILLLHIAHAPPERDRVFFCHNCLKSMYAWDPLISAKVCSWFHVSSIVTRRIVDRAANCATPHGPFFQNFLIVSSRLVLSMSRPARIIARMELRVRRFLLNLAQSHSMRSSNSREVVWVRISINSHDFLKPLSHALGRPSSL